MLAITPSSAGLHSTAVKVVVSDAGMVIHGYAVAREGSHVRVVWAVASGRRRHRAFRAETVFRTGTDRRWDGCLISHGQLAVIRQATR